MNGHPAIAYLIAEQILDERRREARSRHRAGSVPRTRSVRVGRYRLTVTKEAADASRAV
ncbi:MAG TPA: hypothetical protein VF083_13815 [Acidimicrobiia bacterium]